MTALTLALEAPCPKLAFRWALPEGCTPSCEEGLGLHSWNAAACLLWLLMCPSSARRFPSLGGLQVPLCPHPHPWPGDRGGGGRGGGQLSCFLLSLPSIHFTALSWSPHCTRSQLPWGQAGSSPSPWGRGGSTEQTCNKRSDVVRSRESLPASPPGRLQDLLTLQRNGFLSPDSPGTCPETPRRSEEGLPQAACLLSSATTSPPTVFAFPSKDPVSKADHL